MHKIIFAVWVLTFINASLTAQTLPLNWGNSFGSTSDDKIKASRVDSEGNLYFTGYFSQTIDVDPGPGTYNLSSTGAFDIFIVKLDSTGNLVWALAYGSGINLHDSGNELTIDRNGDIYLIGYFNGTIDFDPGPLVTPLTAAPNGSGFLVKLTNSGNFIFAKEINGTTGYVYGLSIDVDDNLNVYSTGWFSEAADFCPGPGTHFLNSTNGSSDVFIQKLDSAGNFVWAKSFGSPYADQALNIYVSPGSYLYLYGEFYDSMDVDLGPDTTYLTTIGTKNLFIVKFDTASNYVWAKNVGEGGAQSAGSFVLDEFDNIYSTGRFSDIVDFDPGPFVFDLESIGPIGSYDMYVQKLDSSGNFQWAKSIGGVGYELGYAISIDPSNQIYVAGNFAGTTDFDPGAGAYTISSTGATDIYILKLNDQGEFAWVTTLGGINGKGVPTSINSNNQHIFLTGYFDGPIDFDPGINILQFPTNQCINFCYDGFAIKLGLTPFNGVSEFLSDQSIQVYPNPFNKSFFVNLENCQNPIQISISNADGRIISTQQINQAAVTEIFLDHPAGMYILTAAFKDETRKFKIIKTN